MGKSFVEASTEIDDLVTKRNETLTKIGNIVALAITDRANNNKVNGLQKDVDGLLKGLSDHEKYLVMLQASVLVAKNKAAGGNKAQHQSSSRDSLFSRFSD